MNAPRFSWAMLTLPVILFFYCTVINAQEHFLPNAYAHNDYKHRHPLHDALERGFAYVEADIYQRKGRLIVSHGPPLFGHRRTLEELYLKPLADSIQSDKENPLKTNGTITLVIDIKTRGNTFQTLLSLLEKYRPLLTSCENGRIITKRITIIVSGKKPSGICCSENHFVFFDSDFRKTGAEINSSNLYPLASCKYSSFLSWRGQGQMPGAEKEKLCSFVQKAHALGRKVRLWASPENQVVWKELLASGVDLINTDKLDRLRQFLLLRKQTEAEDELIVQQVSLSEKTQFATQFSFRPSL